MRWRHVNPIGILLWTLALCAIPAHGQIVSYRDSEGKRVFINADPIPATRAVKTSIRGFTPLAGAMSQGTHTHTLSSASPEMGAAEMANRQKIEVMIREVSARYNVDPALIRA